MRLRLSKAAIECFRAYMIYQGYHVPTAVEYAKNLEEKMSDQNFQNDIRPLLAEGVEYDIHRAYKVVQECIISIM